MENVELLKKYAVDHLAAKYLRDWTRELREGIYSLYTFDFTPKEVEAALKVLENAASIQFGYRAEQEVSQRLVRFMTGKGLDSILPNS